MHNNIFDYSVFVIDPDSEFIKGLSEFLSIENFRVASFDKIENAHKYLDKDFPDIVIMNLKNISRGGTTFIEKIRKSRDVPLVFLSSEDNELEKAYAFSLGADDFLVKPFSAVELVARMKAILRRTGITRQKLVTSKYIEVDTFNHNIIAKVGSTKTVMKLTHTEYNLLAFFANNFNIVISRDELNRCCMLSNSKGKYVVDVHLHNLRKKMAIHGLDDLIINVRGIGFMMLR